MNVKKIRKRILSVILTAALVLSGTEYGNSPVVYASEESSEVEIQDTAASETELADEEDSMPESNTEDAGEDDTDDAEVLEEEALDDVLLQADDQEAEAVEAEPKETEAGEDADVRESSEPVTGVCGDNVVWSYDHSSETLTIKLGNGNGTGAMNNYVEAQGGKTTAPWCTTTWNGTNSDPDLIYKDMTNVIIEAGVTSIGNYAFKGCNLKLTSITFRSNTVTSIGDYAFKNCEKLNAIEIPTKVTSIGVEAFAGCDNLGTENGITINGPATIGKGAFQGCRMLKNATITYADNASVNEDTFLSCLGLETVTLKGNISTIEKRAFKSCQSLTKLEISDGKPDIVGVDIDHITDAVFNNCPHLTIDVKNGVKDIGDYAFSKCSGLERIKISDEAQRIGKGAFSECKGLKEIIIPKNIKIIDDMAFYYADTSDWTLTFEKRESTDRLTIGEQAFMACTLKGQITIPANTTIGATAFSSCTGLTQVIIGENVQLNNEAFQSCTGLTNVEIGKGVTVQGDPFVRCSDKLSYLIYKGSKFENYAANKKYKYFVQQLKFTQPSDSGNPWIVAKEETPTLELQLLPDTGDAAKIDNAHPTVAKNIKWETSNNNIVAISANPPTTAENTASVTITAVAKGDCTITATCDGISDPVTCYIKVLEPAAPVTANKVSGAEIYDDDKVELYCTTPGSVIHYTTDATKPKNEWKTYSETEKISFDGSETSVTITAYASAKEYLDSKDTSFTYTVKKRLKGISFNEPSLKLGWNEGRPLSVRPEPEDAEWPETIAWSSSNEKVATVTPKDGDFKTATVKGISAGEAEITAVCGSFTATCRVTVDAKARVSQVEADPDSGEVEKGTKVKLSCSPSDAEIYYTTNGAVPTSQSTRYDSAKGGIPIDEEVTIKAIAIKAGYDDSEPAEFHYTVKIPVTGISLDPPVLKLGTGKNGTLKVKIQPADATYKEITWVSDDPSVVKVTEDKNNPKSATVKGIKIGKCKVKVTCDGKTAECAIEVTEQAAPVTVEPAGEFIYEDEKITLSCATKNAKIKYTTDGTDPKKYGKEYSAPINVKSVANNQPGITIKAYASAEADGYLDSELLTVTYKIKKKATGIKFDKNSLTLSLDEEDRVRVSFEPEGAEPQERITWTSSDTDVATVTPESDNPQIAAIKGISAGTTTIYATCGSLTAPCQVTVENKHRVSKVVAKPAAGEVEEGIRVTLSCPTEGAKIYYTTDGSDPTSESTPYDSAHDGIIINGSVTIKAVAVKEGYEDSGMAVFNYTVRPKEVPVTGIVLTPSALELGEGQTGALKVTFRPENATPKDITWQTDDPAVAEVTADKDDSAFATVKAVKKGHCTITAACGDGISAKCTVTVLGQAPSVTAEPASGASIYEDEKITLSCANEEAAIYYTTDGTTPTKESRKYSAPISVGEYESGVTIKAFASMEGYLDSEVSTFTYEIKKKITVTGITLNESSLTLGLTEERPLSVSFEPEGAEPQEITWTSSNTSIVTVRVEDGNSANASVKGVSTGIATVTAKCGSLTASCEVTVSSRPRVSQVVADPGPGELVSGTRVKLICPTEGAKIYLTTDGTDPEEEISILYDNALGGIIVTEAMTIKALAVKEGYDDSVIAVFEYTARPAEYPVEGVSLDRTALELGMDETARLTASLEPEDAKVDILEWKTDNPEIASITVDEKDSAQARVTGIKPGTCTVTVSCDGFEASCKVTVLDVKRTSEPYTNPEPSMMQPGMKVALCCDTEGAAIYYTLDGTSPKVAGTRYTGPIVLNDDTAIMAIALKEGYEDSRVVRFDFIVNDAKTDIPGICDQGESGIWVGPIGGEVYTGSAIKLSAGVYDGRKRLTENKDYTVSYKNNKNSGWAEMTVTGKGNYKSKRIVTFVIAPRNIYDTDVIIEDMAYAYDGKSHKTVPVITHNGRKLKAGRDFEVTYGEGDYTSEGTYKLIIKGKGNYTGAAKGKIIITGKDKLLTKAVITAIPAQPYNKGNAVTLPDNLIKVSLGGVTLKNGTDYTVSYANNVDPGKASIIIKGTGTYAGTKKANFKIVRAAADIGGAQCTNSDSFASMEFVKGGCMPLPVLTHDGRVLRQGTDYTVSYKNNKKAGGTAVLIVKGKGTFKGKKEISFNIVNKNISKVQMYVPDVPYTAKANKYQSKPILVDSDGTRLKEGTDYTMVYKSGGAVLDKRSNPVENTEITVEVSGKGNYTGTRIGTYTLKGTSFSAAKIKINNKDYTGRVVTISGEDITSATIKVKGATSQLVYGRDYEVVSYSKNVKKGTATVVFCGKGDYSGEKSVKFKIVSRDINRGRG